MKQRLLLAVLMMVMGGIFPTTAQEDTVVLVTHDSFNVSEAVIQAFEEESGLTVEIVLAGDTGTLVNQAVLSGGAPLGDVMFGVDNTFLGRALEADLFVPYQPAALEHVPEEFIIDPEGRVTPIDYGDVCINYDIAYFEENDLPLPTSLADLTQDVYHGLLVVENPALSSPGLAFLLATIAEFGTEGEYTYLDYWRDLVANDVLVTADWTEAYYGEFSLREGGERPMVVSYASSPPAEVIFADPPVEKAFTASLIGDGLCFRQIEFAGLLKGAENPEGGQKLIDFLLSQPFQEDAPMQMFVFPVLEGAELPAEFTDYAQIPENPASLPIEEINANRDTWIQAWLETVLG